MAVKQTFEKALSELEEIVTVLENGEIPLEEALKTFEKGIKLSNYCAEALDKAEKKIKILTKSEDGKEHIEEWQNP